MKNENGNELLFFIPKKIASELLGFLTAALVPIEGKYLKRYSFTYLHLNIKLDTQKIVAHRLLE